MDSVVDGSSLDAWRSYLADTIGSAWKIEDSALTRDVSIKDAEGNPISGGDLVTKGTLKILTLSWNGKYPHVETAYSLESSDHEYERPIYRSEIQVLDNSCHPDAKIPKHRARDLYDLVACSGKTVKPAGEWRCS